MVPLAGSGFPVRLPKDKEEWRELALKAAPWVAGIAIVALGAGIIKAECDKHEREAHPLRFWGQKKRDEAEDATKEAKAAAKRGWFGLKHEASHAQGKTEALWEDAKAAAKDKASQVEKSASSAGSYLSDKATELGDASKSTAYQTGNKVGAAANSAEESTGKLLKAAGKALEEDGRKAKLYHQGQLAKNKLESKPWWQFW